MNCTVRNLSTVSLITYTFDLLSHYHTMPHFDTLKIYSCGKHCKKGEIACDKQFLYFSQCFLPYMAFIFHFKCTL